jgi:predicted lipid-binding transport protein (Tim44 family)
MTCLSVVMAIISSVFLVSLFSKLGKINNKSSELKEIDENSKSTSNVEPVTNDQNVNEKNMLSKEVVNLLQKFPNFDLTEFLKHSNDTFDTIFNAFISSDYDILKSMLTTALYEEFVQQILKRERKNLKQEFAINHTKTTLDRAQFLVTKAKVLISFHASQMIAMVNADGFSVDNPNKLYRNVIHKWTFERKYDKNEWILSKTSCMETA